MKECSKQATMEALYSQKNIHLVLHEAIKHELDKFLLNWSLIAYTRIPKWVDGVYYASKNKRLEVLNKYIQREGLEKLVVAIAAAILHTHTKQTIQQATGYLQAYLPHEDTFDRARTAAELLALCSSESGMYFIKRTGSGSPAVIEVPHWPLIDKKLMSSFKWINDTCFNPPLVEPPKKVESNYDCAYHTLKEPLILGDLTMHSHKQNYEAINLLNSIEWVFDEDVMKEPEVPSKPLKTKEQHQQFSVMARASKFIYKLLAGKPFWFSWQYDCRGRINSHGYHVNFQAAEYKKACLSFNKYEVLT